MTKKYETATDLALKIIKMLDDFQASEDDGLAALISAAGYALYHTKNVGTYHKAIINVDGQKFLIKVTIDETNLENRNND